jgi:hypothetical protein
MNYSHQFSWTDTVGNNRESKFERWYPLGSPHHKLTGYKVTAQNEESTSNVESEPHSFSYKSSKRLPLAVQFVQANATAEQGVRRGGLLRDNSCCFRFMAAETALNSVASRVTVIGVVVLTNSQQQRSLESDSHLSGRRLRITNIQCRVRESLPLGRLCRFNLFYTLILDSWKFILIL